MAKSATNIRKKSSINRRLFPASEKEKASDKGKAKGASKTIEKDKDKKKKVKPRSIYSMKSDIFKVLQVSESDIRTITGKAISDVHSMVI